MCFGGSNKSTPPPPPPPAAVVMPTPVPTAIAPAVKTARKNEKKAAAQLMGRKGTILTTSRGVMAPADTQKKTLLGQ